MTNSTKVYIDFEKTNINKIRQELKKEFNRKFLVRRGKGRCSNSIHILWNNDINIGQIINFCKERF